MDKLTALTYDIIERIKERAKLPCYDRVPDNTQSPLVIVEVISATRDDTKNTLAEVYNVELHVIAEPVKSSVRIFSYIGKVQRAMFEYMPTSAYYSLINQTNNGVTAIKTDETGERHAVISYSFTISEKETSL